MRKNSLWITLSAILFVFVLVITVTSNSGTHNNNFVQREVKLEQIENFDNITLTFSDLDYVSKGWYAQLNSQRTTLISTNTNGLK